MQEYKHIIISLGGSLVVPENIDIEFLKSFKDLIIQYVNQGFSFVIITGGGRLARNYTHASKAIVDTSNEDLDYIGIATTRLNAELVRVIFGEYAHRDIMLNPEVVLDTNKPIVIGGGWKPGNSSDLAAVVACLSYNANKIINLSNIDYVYDKDPRYNADAKKIENINWADFRTLLPKTWDPGLNSPFDPVAAERAQELGFEVVIMNGKNLYNLKNYLDDVAFIGTVVK